MRPGCDRPAAARVAFDPVALQLWLDPLARRSAPVQELCEFHVERLTVPRGWSATDRRPGVVSTAALSLAPEPERVLDVEPEPEPVPVVDVEPESMVLPEPEPVPEPEPEPESMVRPEPEPEPVLDVEPEPMVHPDPEPIAASAVPSRSTERSADSSAQPRRRRRNAAPSLLSRAFELTGHQESILTSPSADGDEASDDVP